MRQEHVRTVFLEAGLCLLFQQTSVRFSFRKRLHGGNTTTALSSAAHGGGTANICSANRKPEQPSITSSSSSSGCVQASFICESSPDMIVLKHRRRFKSPETEDEL